MGITNPKTVKLLGTVKNMELIVMIDLGATNYFISNLAVQKLKIPCEKCEKIRCDIGNGDEILGQGICWQVHLQLQGIEVVQDFLSLELEISDMILGIEWLETLEIVKNN